MFGYCGTSEADLHALYAALKQSCAQDPTLQAVAEGCSRHCHGWGYVVHAENGLFHYRTAQPIYDDPMTLPALRGPICAIFHGRFASNPDLAGHIFSHPFMMANGSEVIFLAHNGGVSPAHPSARTVDSEWVLEEIAQRGDVQSALPTLKEHTLSALNLLVLRIGRSGGTPASLEYFHFFKSKIPGKAAYYSMYTGALPGGRAVMSSTLTLPAARPKELQEVQAAAFDQLCRLG